MINFSFTLILFLQKEPFNFQIWFQLLNFDGDKMKTLSVFFFFGGGGGGEVFTLEFNFNCEPSDINFVKRHEISPAVIKTFLTGFSHSIQFCLTL